CPHVKLFSGPKNHGAWNPGKAGCQWGLGMVTKELITELEKARDLFEWTLSPSSGPAHERRRTPRLRVRGILKSNPELTVFDPIGAVCFSKTGFMFSEDYWVEAAISIGLSIEDARDIMSAANDMTWRNVNDRREPDPYKHALRKCLVDVTRPQQEIAALSH
ncbi:MAG TPA: hypothetical protein VIJ87_04305, partial [Pyrinomonadaceae bacterium]